MTNTVAAPYRYTECGLDNVLVHGIIPTIDDDGDEVITIRNINGLHRAIAMTIVERPGLMTGKELRFLRTEMGLTQAELAKLIHATPLTAGRWERGESPIDANAETLIRLMTCEMLGIPAKASVQEMTGYSVETASQPPIQIDGSDPEDYRPMAA